MTLAYSLYETARARMHGHRRRKLRAVAQDERLQRLGTATCARESGPLIWVHACGESEETSAIELFRKLKQEDDRILGLITTPTKRAGTERQDWLPAGLCHQLIPEETPQASRAFVNFWRPDVCLWTGPLSHLTLLAQSKASGAGMVLVDTNDTETARSPKRRWSAAAARSVLAQFDRVLAASEKAAKAYEAIGVRPAALEVTGVLQEGSTVLPYDDLAYRILADAMSPRPVWLASATTPEEEQDILDVHRRLLRSSHRLLLILVPNSADRAADLQATLTETGWNSLLYQTGVRPTSDTQILIGSVADLGLWYRLAPTTFMGGTVKGQGGHHPFEPAALGSAIVHGNQTAPYQQAYARLVRAGAARLILNADGLEANLKELQAADVAAEMAHAAWDVCSRGAEVTERVLEITLEALDSAEVRHAHP